MEKAIFKKLGFPLSFHVLIAIKKLLPVGLIFVCLLFPLKSLSQPQFEHFTIEDGLSNNSVRQIIQDKQGFLWFGTLNGLNRYDGNQIRSFTYNPGGESGMRSIRINSLYEDQLGYFWITTFQDQLIRFNPSTEKFINAHELVFNDPGQTSGLYFLRETSPGIIWIYSDTKGLIRIVESQNPDEYQISSFDPHAEFTSNDIQFIHQDRNNMVWISSQSGLISIQSDTSRLIRENVRFYNSGKVSSATFFTCVYETSKGNLLLGTESDGVFIYDADRKGINTWKTGLNIRSTVNQVVEDRQGNILLTTDGQGFYWVEEATGKARHFSHTTTQDDHIGNRYYDIYPDKAGLFWLVSPQRGITLFNPDNKKVRYYGLNPNYRESPGDMDRQSILEDSNGDLWIGLYGGGLYKFNRNTFEFDQYYYVTKNPTGLSSNLILSLFEDRSKNLWIGTFQGGLNKLQLVHYDFEHTEPARNILFKSENEVRSLMEDRLNRLWVGTKDGHIYCYHSADRQKVIFRIPEDLVLHDQQKYVRSNVYSMLEDTEGNLWIGTKGEGLYRIKNIAASPVLKNKKFNLEVFKHDENDTSSISYDNVYALHQDNYGQIWVGTYYGGLDLIENPNEEIIFRHFQNEPDNNRSISDNRVRCLYQDNDDNLWIGTSKGLNLLASHYLNKPDKAFVQYMNNPLNDNTLSNNEVFYVYQDTQDNVWAATYGGGLNMIQPYVETGDMHFKHFLKSDGLPSNVVFSILGDKKGNLWLGTDNGLCKFSGQGRQIERYMARDGTGGNFYSEGTCIQAENGDLIFGQMNGFVRFDPDSITLNTKEYPLVLTGFNVFDQRLVPGQPNSPLTKSIERTEKIELKYDQNFISIAFSVLNFKSPDRIQYSFILENFEEKWNYAANLNKAVYRGLSPGNYTFKVKATNGNGVWMDHTRDLKISISPPLWKTTGAYIVYTFILLILIWLTLHIATKEIRMKNQINYEKRLTEDKLMFYTNISHEFKTPLTLIDNFTNDLLKVPSIPPEANDKITGIKKNSIRLIALIEQLLDFRRIQKGKMELKVRRIEIVSFLREIYNIIQPLATKSNIDFVFKSHVETHFGWIDPKHIERIVINLLSNAFKHTPENKKITLEVNVTDPKEGDEKLTIQVIDNGDGISKEHQNSIFDRFAFIDKDIYNQFKGSGIGLALSNDLARLHKGKITVNSELNKGSTFTLQIPIGMYAYNNQEKDDADDPRTPNSELRSIMIDAIETDQDEPTALHRGKATSAVKSRVLVVEDDEELCSYMSDKLNKYFEVLTAQDGEQGLQMANDLEPDIIVSDIKMPKMDGYELTQQIKNNFETSHIPIILLTAKSSMENKIEGLEFGADDYITKPFEMVYLQKRIEGMISQRKKLKERFSQDPGFEPEKLTAVPNDQKFLHDVISLIENNIKDPHFTIERIIEKMGYSRTLFYKKMKGVQGHAPKEFIRSIKMKKAAVMLREPHAGIAQVGYEVGFNDPEYFSKCFKKYFGETPSEYQRKFK